MLSIERSRSTSTFIRGVRHSILPSLTTEGVAALGISEDVVNKARFAQFLCNDVVCGFHKRSVSSFSTYRDWAHT